MPKHSIKSRRGPIPLVARFKVAPENIQEAATVAIQALWTSRGLRTYLVKSVNGLSDFLNNNEDFPAFKVGAEWRADPDEVKAWVRRQRVRALPDKANEETA